MFVRQEGRGSKSPIKLKRPLSAKTSSGTQQPGGGGLELAGTALTSSHSHATAAVLEPGTLKLFVSHGENLTSLLHGAEATGAAPGVWKLSLAIDVLDFHQHLDQAPIPPPPRLKNAAAATQTTTIAPKPAAVTWDKALAVPVHWSPAQSRVPVLLCQLFHSSDPAVPVAFASLDLAAIILRPLQLMRLHLPLLISSDVPPSQLPVGDEASPCLHLHAVYFTVSSPPGKVAVFSERLLTSLDQPSATAAPSAAGGSTVALGGTPPGKLQVQLTSVTKLRRGCTGVSNPRVSVSVRVPGPNHESEVAFLDGSLSPFGEYAIYFPQEAEAILTIPPPLEDTWSHHPIVDIVLEGYNLGEAAMTELGRVSLPIMDAISKEGHILDACYPLRAPGSCLKVADLRMSVQFVPDDLVYVQQQQQLASTRTRRRRGSKTLGSTSSSSSCQVLHVKVGALRGLYCQDFPGRRDPYVEIGLVMRKNAEGAMPRRGEGSTGRNDEGEEEDATTVISVVRSSISSSGFENLVWDEVVDVPLPPNLLLQSRGTEDPPLPPLLIRLKSAAVLEDASRQLLGTVELPWPEDDGSESGWFQLQHPSDRGVVVGEISLAFLGVAEEDSRLQPIYDDPAAGALTSFFSSVALSPSRTAADGGGTLAGPPSPMMVGFTKEAWSSASAGGTLQQPTRQAAERRLLPATRCSQLRPCGPGFLMCCVTSLQSVAARHHGQSSSATVEAFRASSVYVKIKERPHRREEAEEEDTYQDLDNDSTLSETRPDCISFAPPGGEGKKKPLKARLYPYHTLTASDGSAVAPSDSSGAPRGRHQAVVIVAPLTHGRQSQVRLYFGKGKDPAHRKWYRGTLDPSTAMSYPGREMQTWKLLTPITRSSDDHAINNGPPSPAATDALQPPAGSSTSKIGRAHVLLRYVPHTRGTISVRLGQATLTVGPEASLSEDPSVSYVFNRLFIRVRVMPGGDWVMSAAQDVVFPTSGGQTEQRLSWGEEEVSLGLDTTAIPILKTSGTPVGPCLEVAIFNDHPVVENCLALSFFPLPDLLSLSPTAPPSPFNLHLVHPLTAEPVGQLGVRLAFRHLYTPAYALDNSLGSTRGVGTGGGLVLDGSTTHQDHGSSSTSAARAIRDLKRLFYTLDRGGDGFVNQDEMLAYLTKPVAGGASEGQDLTDLMMAVVKIRGGGADMDIAESTRDIFRSIDVDGNGKISWEEWVSFIDMLRLSHDSKSLLDVGLLQRNAEAMRTVQLSDSSVATPSAVRPKMAANATTGLAAPVSVSIKKTVHLSGGGARDLAMPVTLQTMGLLDLTSLPAAEATSPGGLPLPRQVATTTRISVSGAGGKHNTVSSGGKTTTRRRSVEELEVDNAQLRKRVQALEDDRRLKDVQLRKGLEAEKSRFKKEVGYLLDATRDTITSKQQQTGGKLSSSLMSPGFSILDASATLVPGGEGMSGGGGDEEVLHLRALTQALKGTNEELRSALQCVKAELSNTQMQADLLRSKLSQASRRNLHEEAVKLEIKRLEAARKNAEGSRGLELRSLLHELSVAKQEVRACSGEIAMHHEAADRARRDVVMLRQMLESEQHQCEHYKLLAQRYRSALSVHEHDKVRSRALLHLKEQSMAEAMTRHKLRQDASLTELRAQHAAAEKIQAGMRGCQARAQCYKQRRAALSIQSYFRAVMASRRVAQLKVSRVRSVEKIQSLYRGFTAHKEAQKRRQSVVAIQAGFRGALERRQNREWMAQARQDRQDKAVRIQAAYRTAKQRAAYAGLKRAVQVIKAKLQRFNLRKQKVKRRSAARRIARFITGLIHQRQKSAAFLQKRFRQKQAFKFVRKPAAALQEPPPSAAPPPAVALPEALKVVEAAVAPVANLAAPAPTQVVTNRPSEDDEALFRVTEVEEELAAERAAKEAAKRLLVEEAQPQQQAPPPTDPNLFDIDSPPSSPRSAAAAFAKAWFASVATAGAAAVVAARVKEGMRTAAAPAPIAVDTPLFAIDGLEEDKVAGSKLAPAPVAKTLSTEPTAKVSLPADDSIFNIGDPDEGRPPVRDAAVKSVPTQQDKPTIPGPIEAALSPSVSPPVEKESSPRQPQLSEDPHLEVEREVLKEPAATAKVPVPAQAEAVAATDHTPSPAAGGESLPNDKDAEHPMSPTGTEEGQHALPPPATNAADAEGGHGSSKNIGASERDKVSGEKAAERGDTPAAGDHAPHPAQAHDSDIKEKTVKELPQSDKAVQGSAAPTDVAAEPLPLVAPTPGPPTSMSAEQQAEKKLDTGSSPPQGSLAASPVPVPTVPADVGEATNNKDGEQLAAVITEKEPSKHEAGPSHQGHEQVTVGPPPVTIPTSEDNHPPVTAPPPQAAPALPSVAVAEEVKPTEPPSSEQVGAHASGEGSDRSQPVLQEEEDEASKPKAVLASVEGAAGPTSALTSQMQAESAPKDAAAGSIETTRSIEKEEEPLTKPIAAPSAAASAMEPPPTPIPRPEEQPSHREREQEAVAAAATMAHREVLLSALVGRAVKVRLPAVEEGEEEELLPAKVVGYDVAKNTVRVAYDDDPDTSEDLNVDSPDLVITSGAAATIQHSAAVVGPLATASSSALPQQQQQPLPPTSLAAEGGRIGWTVRVDLGGGMSEMGKVVGINKANGNLLVSFPALGEDDPPEECGEEELEFVEGPTTPSS